LSWPTCSLLADAEVCVAVPLRRSQSASGAPAEFAALLIANGLVVVGSDRMPWFRLPDIHVIAAQKPL
jgi:hypothetical protein